MTAPGDAGREFLRHTLATLAYRGGKTIRNVPAEFGSFELGAGTRTPLAILAHINDLLDWACHLARGRHVWNDSVPGSWAEEVDRFFAGTARLDALLASGDELGKPAELLFQGPIADALTHVGQIALLRRRVGIPVRGENYFKADIRRGRVGSEQAEPRVEFD